MKTATTMIEMKVERIMIGAKIVSVNQVLIRIRLNPVVRIKQNAIIKIMKNLNNDNNLSAIFFGLRYLGNETDPNFDEPFVHIFDNEYYGVQRTYLHFPWISL